MLYSLLLKLAMVAVTAGVVFWIGWTVPQSRIADADTTLNQTTNLETQNESERSAARHHAGPSPVVTPRASQVPVAKPVPAKLDLNRATEQDIEALPGIGPVLAERIVEYRQSRGGFRNVEQLRNVKGIGKKKYERIRALVDVMSSTTPARGAKRAA